MRVNDLLAKKNSVILSTTSGTPLLDAVKKINENNVGALLVMDNEKLVGIISERDVLHATAQHGSNISGLKVENVMSTQLVTCTKDETIDNVMGLMTVNHIRHLPILEDEKLVGIISIGDVVKAQLAKTRQEADDLRDYIHGRR